MTAAAGVTDGSVAGGYDTLFSCLEMTDTTTVNFWLLLASVAFCTFGSTIQLFENSTQTTLFLSLVKLGYRKVIYMSIL